MMRNPTPQTLGKYQLLARLGQGGMAQVYRARQPVIERDVAIKVLHPHLAGDDNFVERFKREARGLGQLRHPHIVSVIDFDTVTQPGAGPAEADHYLVMDFIAGPTLAEVLREQGPLPLAEALLIGEQIADALAYAHQQGVIHRDVKPGNIMFRDAARQHPVLTDFGIVHLLADAALTLSGTLAGTPAYMSPEAAQGAAVDARSDLYSLGVVLYELLTGEPPYQGDTPVQVMMQHMTAPLPPLRQLRPDLPEMVVQIIERALAKTPAERFQRAEALHQALMQVRLLINNGHAPQTQLLPLQTLVAERSLTQRVSSQPGEPAPAAARRPHHRQPVGDIAGSSAQPAPNVSKSPITRTVALVALLVMLVVGMGLGAPVLFPWATDALGEEYPPPGAAAGHLQISPGPTGQALLLTLAALPTLPASQHYHAWVVAQGGVLFDLGALTNASGPLRHMAVAQQNVLGSLAAVLVTQEALAAPVAPADQVVVCGVISATAATALNHLLVASPLPLAKPLLSAAAEQLAIAQEHGVLLGNALQAGDLALAQRHAEHVVNILDGETGQLFGDLNLDGEVQNPGDGVGARVYLRESAAAFTTLARARMMLDNALTTVETVLTTARQVAAADSLAEAQRTAAASPAALAELLGAFRAIDIAELATFPLQRCSENGLQISSEAKQGG